MRVGRPGLRRRLGLSLNKEIDGVVDRLTNQCDTKPQRNPVHHAEPQRNPGDAGERTGSHGHEPEHERRNRAINPRATRRQ